ncbi:hypothetical protein GCM10022393_00620 [Aquimarina addita]|uniref:TonB-dependent receptor n=1 Tax=Aquimarina addita TaxID=870485 RepID=A0ABP7X729_9FLAO
MTNSKITDLISGNQTSTDTNGEFNFMIEGNIIEISQMGYQTKKISFSKDQYLLIELAPTVTNLSEVYVNSQSILIPEKYATESVEVIDSNDMRRGNMVELHPILNKVPGVFMQNATLNTNRITIRGIGARNLFGTANIRTYFGDIPLTDGNGESSIEDLELASVSRIDIHKGPAASSYGVGLGGTILLKPQYTYSQKTDALVSTSLGSYGLRRFVTKASIRGEKSNLTILYGNTHSDGYRYNNEYDRNTVSAISSITLGIKDTLSFLGSFMNLKAEIPSSLDQEDYINSPRQAAFTWGNSQANEDVDYGIFGLTWQHGYNKNLTQHTSIFTSFRTNDEDRPFNILEEKSNIAGIRSRIIGNTSLGQRAIKWTIGGELFYELYDNSTYQNLYEEFPTGTGSIRGSQLSDLDEIRIYYTLFAEVFVKATEKLRFNAGIHLNQTFFDIQDNFMDNGIDSSGDFSFSPIVSPKLGINYKLHEQVIAYGSIAHGFSTPTTSETLLPDAEFNPDLQPEIGWNYEIGSRFTLLNNKLKGTLSLYSLRVKDLLVTRRTTEDNFFAINAGKTTHNGIEGEINYTLIKTKTGYLDFFVNASVYDYKFDEFIDLESDFSGNDLTGVPSEVINAGIDLITTKGLYGNLNVQHVGEIPANDNNTVISKTYQLIHGKIGYANNLGKHLRYNIYIGANNILDTTYASQLQVNATGFGANAPRYFYPGLPFNAFSGVDINYRL